MGFKEFKNIGLTRAIKLLSGAHHREVIYQQNEREFNLIDNAKIQKLIFSDYNQLVKEMILVESPFAETTIWLYMRDGYGLREVALALTKTKLIVASDALETNYQHWCSLDVDPCIETLELVPIYPLKFLTLSIFRNRRRNMFKARSYLTQYTIYGYTLFSNTDGKSHYCRLEFEFRWCTYACA
ncbi:PREDICTED: LOW QUALITY PROTEIN: uncharacterized protein LOC105366063 [Ceratosolen solmsi marchali]|uniref:LOW QUALITY PROTEIN: uncharacterized protein LOC105366063 n=1 Tax=Ceratosolen solmsi marchali TaxID=326594 RepID=A0AAJ7E006_9HYME|nr:PREDICTED: LOW QUALITY PROTEIN: uncharacterized protein LOC105366063 [Ceratosolen solmsi marchali]